MKSSVKMIAGLAVSGLLAACASVEYVEVRPQCEPPPVPALPDISRGALWDALGDSEYRRLEAYINGVWAWGDEQAALLSAICAD